MPPTADVFRTLQRCNAFNDLTSPIGQAAENSHRQGPEVCPSRQARDFEAVTGLTNVAILTIHLRPAISENLGRLRTENNSQIARHGRGLHRRAVSDHFQLLAAISAGAYAA